MYPFHAPIHVKMICIKNQLDRKINLMVVAIGYDIYSISSPHLRVIGTKSVYETYNLSYLWYFTLNEGSMWFNLTSCHIGC